MTAIDFGPDRRFDTARDRGRPATGFAVEEFYWGYVVRDTRGAPLALVAAQAAAWAGGILCAIAAPGLFVMPGAWAEGPGGLRLGAAVVFAAVAAILLWFASRGAVAELQIDTRQGEVREIIRNRAGKPTVGGRHGFDSIGGVFIDRTGDRAARGRAVLVIRLGNTAQVLPVATGPAAGLEPLRDRLGRDLVVRPRQAIVAPRRAA